MPYGKRKYAKKPVRKARKFTKKPMRSMAKLSGAVRKLQSQTAGEKKRITTFFNQSIGQVDGNTDGVLILDVTPIPASGVQTNQRNGAQFKLHSSNYQFMIGQASATSTAIHYKMTWFMVKGAPYSSGTLNSQFLANVYNPNPFISGSIRDYNAQYNPDYFNSYKVIRTVRGTVLPDQLSDTLVTKSFNIGFKYNRGMGHNIRFNQNTNGVDNLFEGQILLVIQCDRGNASNSVANTFTTGIYTQAINTGLYMQYNKIDYFYDN